MISKWCLADNEGFCFDVHEDLATLPDYGGVYLFVTAGGDGEKPLFAGYCDNFRAAINDGHPRWADGLEMGMNQIHVLAMSYDHYRDKFTREFVARYRPPLN
ncbi:MAG: DUF2808 domain-containing protein [Negativicutes bacterium]|nr:DUF2808 domain-containing protein [Negativicutes bacterium]